MKQQTELNLKSNNTFDSVSCLSYPALELLDAAGQQKSHLKAALGASSLLMSGSGEDQGRTRGGRCTRCVLYVILRELFGSLLLSYGSLM